MELALRLFLDGNCLNRVGEWTLLCLLDLIYNLHDLVGAIQKSPVDGASNVTGLRSNLITPPDMLDNRSTVVCSNRNPIRAR